MSNVPSELRDDIPTFDHRRRRAITARSTGRAHVGAHGKERARDRHDRRLFASIFFGVEAILRWTNTPTYVFPKPIDVVRGSWNEFWSVFAHHLWVTMYEFLAGFAIGSAIGLVLAALITQKPFAEKVIAPYILIMVTTPMIALVPFLRLKMGFGSWPLIIAVALASGPMVMLNSATGFRRTDLAKIALARSYGASTFQIFRKIRFPLALPMIIVGFMVGSIFGLLTASAARWWPRARRGGSASGSSTTRRWHG